MTGEGIALCILRRKWSCPINRKLLNSLSNHFFSEKSYACLTHSNNSSSKSDISLITICVVHRPG